MIPLSDYIVHEFNNKAELADKIKVMILTMFNTFFITIISVQGLVSLFDIKNKFWPYVFVVFLGISNFRIYRFWFVGNVMRGNLEPNNKDTTPLDKTEKM